MAQIYDSFTGCIEGVARYLRAANHWIGSLDLRRVGGRPRAVPLLVAMGYDSLSMSVTSCPLSRSCLSLPSDCSFIGRGVSAGSCELN